ncbi:hypothetical protein Tsubulata_035180, partial [Turnera subulata]
LSPTGPIPHPPHPDLRLGVSAIRLAAASPPSSRRASMLGRKGYELVKDFARGEKDQLKPFNENVFNEVINECVEHYDGLQKLIRYNRAETIQNLVWKAGFDGLELPQDIMEKLSPGERNYYLKHSDALRTYMGKVDVDLSVDMVPPKDPCVKVRILEDLDAGILLSDMTVSLKCNSIHFLKRTDAEKYVALGLMEVLVD